MIADPPDEMLDAVMATLGDRAGQTLVLRASVPIGDILTRIGQSRAVMVVLLLDDSLPAVDRAMLLAAVAVLAVERAPDGRIGAVDIMVDAAIANVAAAARFLVDAGSTTGQILRIARAD